MLEKLRNCGFANRLSRRGLTIMVCIIVCTLVNASQAQPMSFEQPPIDYQTAAVDDDVSRLMDNLESGKSKLPFDSRHGYLKPVLEALDVPVSSQTLVFSKTSMQVHRISPRRPRALYFNDDVYVGWCQEGEVLEIIATDARQGPIFYTLKQASGESPIIKRDKGQCLICHASSRTQNVPGYLVRSVFAGPSGQPHFGSGTFTTDQSSPFQERWGGWYVTGTHGEMRHMGNLFFEEDERNDDLEVGANRKTLDGLVSTQPYLSPHSDLVALMVLEHQTQMHNAITYANYETRQALHQSYMMNELLDREEGFVSESAQRRIKAAAENVVEHLLMCDEFSLRSPVAGTSAFADEFMSRGPRDANDRSLRDLDLQKRLFRYPCSYLIYSPSFDGLPDEVRQPVVTRLKEVLDGHDTSEAYAHLSVDDRRSIRQILEATKSFE